MFLSDSKLRHHFEQLWKFEDRMESMIVHICPECFEYCLKIKPKKRKSANSIHRVCQTCRSSKRMKFQYIDRNIQPVWFRRNSDGSIETDEYDNPLPQFNIPPELNNLSIAEKLLIQRACPYVPVVHLKMENVGLKGQCICFPQDMTEMCNILPQERSQAVKRIRQIVQPHQANHQSEILKVNRHKVLKALHWLKIHHAGYHDITIKPTNLDWIPTEKEEDDLETHESIFGPRTYIEHQSEAAKALSDTQRIDDNQTDFNPSLAVQSIQPNIKPQASESRTAKDQSHTPR